MNRKKTGILSALVATLILVTTPVSYSAIIRGDGAEIVVLSPQNLAYATCATSVVPLTFTINETICWIGYSLDGQANITVSGNTTLTRLTDGDHYITVYANDTYSYVSSSDTIHFTIIMGDATRDGYIGGMDLFYLAVAYGRSDGHYYYDSRCDFDYDGDVDSLDLFTLVPNYGKKGIIPDNYIEIIPIP